MAKEAHIAILLLLCVAMLSKGQESCPSNNTSSTFVGFTALTPDQLKTEIRTNLKESMDTISENLSQTIEEQSLVSLKEINDTVQEGLEMIHELNSELGMMLLENIEQVVAKQVKEAVANVTQDIVANITQLLLEITPPPPPPSTRPPPTTQAPTTVMPTTQPTTKPPEPPTTEPTEPTEPETTTPTTEAPTEPETTPAPTTAEPTTTPPEPTTNAPTLPPLGLTPVNPAGSCQDILNERPDSASGTYWLKTTFNTGAVQAYCDMERTCGGTIGGWMRVVVMNMKNSRQSCPQNFRLQTSNGLRVCRTRHTGAGCRGTIFPVNGVSYSQVCGRVIGYQDRTPNAFFPYHTDSTLTIDDPYVDGISITHGIERQHVWTFVAALDETRGHLSACKCSNTATRTEARIPHFVGNDYFCDTGSRGPVGFEFYGEDPLWDGDGCGDRSTCCTFNNPPWFHKSLGGASNEDLEMRVCRDASVGNEDILFELVELYVR